MNEHDVTADLGLLRLKREASAAGFAAVATMRRARPRVPGDVEDGRGGGGGKRGLLLMLLQERCVDAAEKKYKLSYYKMYGP